MPAPTSPRPLSAALRRLLAAALAAAVCAGPFAAGQSVLVDRIVAVVDDDPIFLSDVEQVIAIDQLTPEEGEDADALRRRILDRLIDQRLRLHQVQLYEIGQVSVEDVERRLDGIRERFDDAAAFRGWLLVLGLDEASLRHLITRQLLLLLYVEERLGPRVFVDLDDIRAYYETELTAEMARQGKPLPPIAEVREAIRGLLRERRLNQEIEAWTYQLRQEADVVDSFERVEGGLPPVVERIEKD